MPYIYRCTLTLLEATFFSSREISNFYQTEPYLGNYGLAYALKFCRSPYFNDGTIRYREDLGSLNEQGIYVTPGMIIGEPRFTVGQFNAQTDTYWYAMGNNGLIVRPDGTWAERVSSSWYIVTREGEKGRKIRPENRPQVGRIRMLAIGNRAVCYVVSHAELHLPSYIRLGKFMSKARVEVEPHFVDHLQETTTTCHLLTLADLAPTTRVVAYDLINIPPTPLVRNARIISSGYRLSTTEFVPAGMHFAVEGLP